MEELIISVDSWNLACDIKLIEYLKQFSQNHTERTNKLTKSIDELSFEAKDVEVRLKNTLSSFYIMADSQFIENVRFVLFIVVFDLNFKPI
jgi:hypothetical protein